MQRPGQPIPRTSLAQQVAEALFQRLVNGDLQPGDHLGEIELAEELQVSRTPVREAILHLAALGLLQRDTHRGSRVAQPSVPELVQVYEVRESLEGLAARLFAERAGPIQRQELFQTRRELELARSRKDALGVRVLDFNLHRQIIRGCDNRYLGSAGYAESLMLLAYLVRDRSLSILPGLAPQPHDPHVALMAAIEAHDGDEAEAAMRAHIRGTRMMLSAVIDDQ
ncbi:MAG: GntR family transcriptional regulator [Armatimonadetes bacterium]|nr:GntR family transcriptional regulator [Armatimonadota bacterium]